MRNGNVLVVEDDDAIRPLLVEFLAQHPRVTVEAARDGVEALHLLSIRHYHVIVLDVMMPKMSGIDLLDSIAAMLSDPSIKHLEAAPAVVVVTATPPTTLPSHTLRSRFPTLVRAVLRKPLDMDALLECVREALGPPTV
jgi:CheY-like chemotaxis protein